MCLRQRRFQTFQFASAIPPQKKTDEDSTETFIYYFGNDFGMPQHFGQGCDLVFYQLIILTLSKLYCLLKTLEQVKRKTLFLVDHLVLVSLCVLVIVRRHIIQQ